MTISEVKLEITTEQINKLYQARKDRLIHPKGSFDKAKRWYPTDEENSDNFTATVRSPSARYPYSYMLAARTLKHVKALAVANPEYFVKLLEEIS